MFFKMSRFFMIYFYFPFVIPERREVLNGVVDLC